MKALSKLTVFVAAFLSVLPVRGATEVSIYHYENVQFVYRVNLTDKIARLWYVYDRNDKKVRTMEIPSKIKYTKGGTTYTLTVTKIAENAFGDAQAVNITIPNTVTEIGDAAFSQGYTKHVNIPTKVEVIGESAYSDCSGLGDVKIPATCRKIGHFAFAKSKMSSLAIADGDVPLTIGQGAFMQSNVTKVTLPMRLTSMGNRAFSRCSSLQEAHIYGVKLIDDWSFEECTSLTTVTIGSGVTEIGFLAFAECPRLANISWPTSVTVIGDGAFQGCTSLSGMNFLPGIQSIGQAAFSTCTAMTYLTFPASLKSLGYAAFAHCDALKSVKSEAPTPPQAYENSFPDCVKNITLDINTAWIPAYRNADGWSKFQYLTTGVEDTGIDTRADDVKWYDLHGNQVGPDHLSKGIYIRIANDKASKVTIP